MGVRCICRRFSTRRRGENTRERKNAARARAPAKRSLASWGARQSNAPFQTKQPVSGHQCSAWLQPRASRSPLAVCRTCPRRGCIKQDTSQVGGQVVGGALRLPDRLNRKARKKHARAKNRRGGARAGQTKFGTKGSPTMQCPLTNRTTCQWPSMQRMAAASNFSKSLES